MSDYGTNEVADQAMAHTLNLVRKMYMTNSDIRQGDWNFINTMPVRRINTLTTGIIGLGRIGLQYAARMHAFGARIIATDHRNITPPDYVAMVGLPTA